MTLNDPVNLAFKPKTLLKNQEPRLDPEFPVFLGSGAICRSGGLVCKVIFWLIVRFSAESDVLMQSRMFSPGRSFTWLEWSYI